MANQSVLELAVGTGKWDAGLKKAKQSLDNFTQANGGLQQALGKDSESMQKFVQMMGKMDSTAKTAKGQMNDYKSTIEQLTMQYNRMTDAQKKTIGQDYLKSIDQLKQKYKSVGQEIDQMNQSLNKGQFGSVIDTLGSKLGISGNLTEMLTSKTAMLTGAVGAGIAIVTKATEAWAGYNAELAKQDQITTVTTGLKGDEANKMTDMARALVDTYKVDFREAINAANTLMSQFGESGEQAMQLLRDGMQGMIQGDGGKLLSMIQQYAPAFRDAGVSASQLVAVIQNSEGGIFTDQNMNAIVMGIKNIRLMTKATSDALAQLGIDGEKMSQQLSDGSMTVFDALKQVSVAIQGVNSNSKAAGDVMQQVFGRQGVSAGTNLGKAIETLNTNLDETKKKTGEVGEALADLQTANEKLNKAIRDCFEYDGWDQMANGIKANLVTALATVLDYIGKIKGSLTDFVGSGIKAGEAPKPEPKYNNGVYWEQKDANGNVMSGRYWNNQRVSQSEYEKLQKSSIVSPTNTPKGGNKSGKTTPDPLEGSIDAQIKKVQDLQKAWQAAANDSSREEIKKQLDEAQYALDKMIGKVKDRPKMEVVDMKTIAPNGGIGSLIQDTFTRQQSGLTELKQKIKLEIDTEALKADTNTLQTILKDAIKNGIDGVDSQLMVLGDEIARGINVPDEAWQGILDQYNALREKIGLEPIKIDFATGKSENLKAGKDIKASDDLAKINQDVSKITSGIGGIFSGIQQMGFELPEGLSDVIGMLQGMTTLMTTITTILSVIEATTSVTAATSSVKAVPLIGTFLAGGGVVRAAGGYEVPGNYFSGDQVPALLNSGEVVLNRAQTAGLAQELEGERGGGNGGTVKAILSGEQAYIMINRYTKRSGKGELVTWK